MPGAYAYGWCVETGKFVKLRVDEDGSIHMVGYVDELEDIGDVLLTALATNDILYRDATGKWKNIAHLGVAAAHHAKYTNAEAKAAAVQAGAITDGVTKAPTHDAVYPIALLAAAALPAVNKYTNGEAVSAVEAAGLALASGKNIKVISALTEVETWSGLTAVMTAGISLQLPLVCYAADDGKMKLAYATNAATMPAIALALESIVASNSGEFLLQGFVRKLGWDWTPGGLLYVSQAGAGLITQARPALPGQQVQVIGVAITADTILFNPSYELVEIS